MGARARKSAVDQCEITCGVLHPVENCICRNLFFRLQQCDGNIGIDDSDRRVRKFAERRRRSSIFRRCRYSIAVVFTGYGCPWHCNLHIACELEIHQQLIAIFEIRAPQPNDRGRNDILLGQHFIAWVGACRLGQVNDIGQTANTVLWQTYASFVGAQTRAALALTSIEQKICGVGIACANRVESGRKVRLNLQAVETRIDSHCVLVHFGGGRCEPKKQCKRSE